MAATVPPSLVKQAESILKRVRKWDTEFLCLGTKKESFNVPQPDEVMTRITANLDYFRVNYGICLTVFALLSVIIYPNLLVLLCVFSVLWYALLTQPAHLRIQVGAVLVTRKHISYCLSGLNTLAVLTIARTTILATVGASFLFVVTHAAMHSVPAKAKTPNENEDIA
eukprot:TRINITY_DN1724_c0_g1_i1.p1 TRINITY_DN1724_c0_g1~~TRINITY_DN1724_c0_g1_i1.p1  ORF type:complete len:182 (+),score=22.51 TRINITY_DN1724_c0_g1_i1:43-546(+)